MVSRDKGRIGLLSASIILVLALTTVHPAHGWANGYAPTMNVACSRCYGTHDFLAEHALTALPYDSAYFWLMRPESKPHGVYANELYLYGTEIPDFGTYRIKADWRLHSVYYSSDGSLVDDHAAKRAQESYDRVLSYLGSGDMKSAAEWMGITSHYVTDVASYWHVMGKGDEWVDTARYGLTYENRVNEKTNSYNAEFASCLVFDGKLEIVSAYDATLKLAYDTTFDTSGAGRTATWMDQNYGIIGMDHPYVNPSYRDRVCQSLSLAFNALADLIYSTKQPSITSTATLVTTSPVVTVTTSAAVFTTTVRETSHVVSTASITESLLSLATTALAPALLVLVIAVTVLLWSRSRKKASR